MAWVDICSKTYDSNYPGGYVKVVVQYDDSSFTTTSLTCRTIGYLTSYNGSHGDTYFIYSSDGGISRICYLGGTSTKKDGSVYYTGNSFKLTKDKKTTYFTLPELRLCNDGSHRGTSSYTDSNGRGYAIYWNDSRHMWTTVNSGGSTISTSKYVTPGGTPGTVSIRQTAGDNTITFFGTLGSYGNCNNMSSATLYYWMNGTTKYKTHALTVGDGTSWDWTQEATEDDRVWAYVSCTYDDGDTHNCSETWADCYYYGTGDTPGAPTISYAAGNNTITISGNRGNSPSNNAVKSSTLYYKFAGASKYKSITLDTSSTTYSKTITIGSANNNKKLSAKVETEYNYDGKKTSSETTTTNALLYYSPVNTGSVTFTDNGNNTFSITGTRGTNGTNNKAKSATLYWTTTKNSAGNWTYTAKDNTQAFGTTGSGSSLVVNNTSTKSNISIPTNGTSDTVTVAGAVVTTGTYTVNGIASTDTGWKTANIKLYKAPTAPSNIKLSYKKSRLTVKENWTLEWTGGTQINNSSPVKGYRIRTWVKRAGKSSFTTIPLKNNSDEIKTTDGGSGDNRYYYDREDTTTKMTVYPVNNDFSPGDQVYFTISCYTRNANGSNVGLHSTSIESPTYTVQNAGIMRVKVSGKWKEGTVWVKTGGKWKEATSVHTKVSNKWKEST